MSRLPRWIRNHPKLIHAYRPNVAAVIVRKNNHILWCERDRHPYFWQFPQGGVDAGEDLETALFRELKEELGIRKELLTIKARLPTTVRYEFPNGIIAQYLNKGQPSYIGQEQHWFLLEFLGTDADINLDYEGAKREFRSYTWGNTQYLEKVSTHKRKVYSSLLKDFHLI